MRLAAASGAVLLVLMWSAVLPWSSSTALRRPAGSEELTSEDLTSEDLTSEDLTIASEPRS